MDLLGRRAKSLCPFNGDVDVISAARYDIARGKEYFSPDDDALRTHFEEHFVLNMRKIYPRYNLDAYKDEAYGRGGWLRHVARFAIYGAYSSEDDRRYNALEEDWAQGKLQYLRAELRDLSLS